MTRNGIKGIDHVIVGVRDLDAARARWTRLGFTLSPRGRHIGQETANYCIMFAADYIELLGLAGPAAANPATLAETRMGAGRLAAFLASREGLMATAFAPDGSAAAAREALLRLGIDAAEPRPLGRRLELPEGEATPRFSLVALSPAATPALDCFICEHLTPELMRRPQWLDHPNGATGLRALYVLVDHTGPLLPAYDRLFGLVQVTTTDAVAAVDVGRHRIVFSTPDDFRTMHPGLDLDPAFRPPGIAAVEIGVANLQATGERLTRAGIAVVGLPGRGLAVPAREANGAILIFSAD